MSGSISGINLPYYPFANRTPGFFADVDGSKANTSLFQQRAWLIGYMLASGTATPGVAFLATSQAQVGISCGVNSMVYEMFRQYRIADSFGEVWILPLPSPTGTAATGTLTLAGTCTSAGSLSIYLGGMLVTVPSNVGDTAAVLAARLVQLMATTPDLQVTGAAVGAVVTFTALHTGITGNDIDLRQNYLGAPGGEAPVPGITATFVPMASGSGVPANLAAALSTMGDRTADFICSAFTDSATLTALDTFLNETGSGRWSWISMTYGGYFSAARGTAGTLAAFGQGRNGKFGSGLMVLPSEPEPVWLHAADYCAQCAISLRADPGQPLQYILLNTKAALPADRLTRSLRNTLLYDGVSTKFVNAAGQNVLERACTFYQTNLAGAVDNSFLDVETIYSLANLLRGWQDRMATLFARKKLLEDGNIIPAGSNAVTPKIISTATIAWYREECAAGNAQDPDQFAAAIISQNAGNGTVKSLLPFILVNQLRQIAALAQFTKP